MRISPEEQPGSAAAVMAGEQLGEGEAAAPADARPAATAPEDLDAFVASGRGSPG